MSAPTEERHHRKRQGILGAFGDGRSDGDGASPSGERNLLLSLLPESAYASLEPHLEPVTINARQVAWRPEGRIYAVYFPRSAVFSLLTPMQKHSPVES